MNKPVVFGVILLLGAIASGVLLMQRNRAPEQTDAATENLRSAYVLHDFELIALNEEGKEAFSVRAPYLQETPGQRTIELEKPVFFLPSKDASGKHWQLRAENAWINEDQTEVQLHHAVHGQSPEGAERPMQLRTEQLTVYPQEDRATSDTLVTIEQPATTMTGRGMQALLSENRVTLLSEVKARYVPNR